MTNYSAQTVYRTWKSLRNGLRKYDIHDSLATIRWYFTRKQSPRNLGTPYDLEPHPNVDDSASFLPWELEILAREIIINSPNISNPKYTMRSPNGIARIYDKMRSIENTITEIYINQTNITREFSVRLAHRQFKYQTERPNMTNIIRYSNIFSDPNIDHFVSTTTGLTTKQIYTISSGLWYQFESNFSLTISGLFSQVSGISDNDITVYISYFSQPLESMKTILSDPGEHQMNDKFLYAYNSMYRFPLMVTEREKQEVLICPLPTLLVWRFTSGLYYDLININTFGNEFGLSYERYVGEVLSASLVNSNKIVIPGEPNLPNSPRRCDWIIDTPHDVLIIETKAKRLSMAARTEVISTTVLDTQLDVLGEAIKQAYESLIAYRQQSYSDPVYTLDLNKKAYISVVTLEEWYLMGDQILKLNDIVKQKLTALNIDLSILFTSPYAVMSSDDIEHFAFLAKTMSISDIIQPYIDGWRTTYLGHEFGLYMDNKFKNEFQSYNYIFRNNTSNLFTIPLP